MPRLRLRHEPRRARPSRPPSALDDDADPLWYKDAIIYQVHVRAYQDSNADGVGDFRGLTQRLDHLRDLGATAIWLLPFFPSPLRDDGYDIADHYSIHPDYGNLRDFRRFLEEAHARDLRVIIELVLNHTSDQHEWFQRARRAPAGSPEREFYVWSDTRERYEDARIIFQDFETSNWTWDPVAGAYYWHRFYSHQPDLNYDNPAVQEAILEVVDHWFDMGVDGMRLDAVPYLFERDGTDCENLPETHAFLKRLRAHVDEKYGDRMLIGEANQWPEDAVRYFGEGDECHAAFHFPLMPRLFMALHMEDRFPVYDIMEQTPPLPSSAQWLLFLRNHDELTLEMVTDEERDSMYRVYAQDPQARINLGIRRRLAPLLGGDRRRVELLNALIFSLPGTPILYYGDEIGMGDNYHLGDRNGVRTPMQWSADRNGGFSRANPQRLYLPVVYDPEYSTDAVNVETAEANPNSLLWWMRRLVSLRSRYQAFGRGSLEFLQPGNRKVIAYRRERGDQRLLVVANLSRFAQHVELDLAALEGRRPVELFGNTPFPPIGTAPYPLTLGPHGFYWFRLEGPGAGGGPLERPVLRLPRDGWTALFLDRHRRELEAAMAEALPRQRWFRSKSRRVREVDLRDVVPLLDGEDAPQLALFDVGYDRGEPETYVVPVAHVSEADADMMRRRSPNAAFAVFDDGSYLVDALAEPRTAAILLDAIRNRSHRRGREGDLVASTLPPIKRLLHNATPEELASGVSRNEQTNTSLVYGERVILKVFRRLDEGMNPDLEVGRHLTERRFLHVAPLAGTIEYERPGHEPMTVALLQAYERNEGDAWRFTVDRLGQYYENCMALIAEGRRPSMTRRPLADLARVAPTPAAQEAIGAYLESARLLGQRTGQMHKVLADPEDPAFRPERFTRMSQRALYQAMRSLNNAVWPALEQRLGELGPASRALARETLARRSEVEAVYRALLASPLRSQRIRVHGDYHLGQVLYSGNDFVIIDFEGEPARPMSERRIKRSPLRDVAGIVRSYQYAAYQTLRQLVERGAVSEARAQELRPWARSWTRWVSAAFLRGYLAEVEETGLVPKDRDVFAALLQAHLVEKAVYEIGYELDHRPDWVDVPLEGLLMLLEAER